MNEQTWTALGVIVALIAAAVSAYFLARQNAREQQRQHDEKLARDVDAATAPLKAELRDRDRRIDVLERRIEQKDRRIEQLEDELRRAGR